jgi:acyl-CoA reductase-like NAD-dependent aldehyde dehydrogenase
MGKPITESLFDVEETVSTIDDIVELAPSWIKSEQIEMEAKKAYIHYEPLGPILIILPWNYPLDLTIENAIP